MLPDRVSNPGPLTYESGALPIALRGPAPLNKMAARAKNRKTFKRLLLLSQCIDFEIILQDGSLGDPLPK